jgi:nucleoside-diphosphate-sugar epimerase
MSIALVTGATGFIGSHLVRRLVRDGVSVHALCRPTSNFWRLADVLPKIKTHAIDLTDSVALGTMVRALRPEQIFHLASATVVAGTTAAPSELVATNLMGTINLIEACESVDYRGLVCTGDSFEYTPSPDPLRESSACQPLSLHGITKLAATLYARGRALTAGRPVVTLRMFSTYGPNDNPRRLVPRMIAAALDGTPMLLSRPEIARDWIYVDDVVALYLEVGDQASRVAGKIFNAGSGRGSDLEAVVTAILRLASSQAEARWGAFPAPDHDAHPWIADMQQTFETFRWRPLVSLDEGLRRTIAAAATAEP